MKKGQSGVSLIALVITIIVVIILAAIAFGTSTSTIKNANWSDFVNDIAEVKGQLEPAAITLQGNEVAGGNNVSIQQAYNYVAKGATVDGTDANWLSRSQAETIPCTHLKKSAMKQVIGMDLPAINVNTESGTKVEVSYFVTPEGQVFVWPPFEHDGRYWVNGTTVVTNGTTEITKDTEGTMYGSDFTFKVGNSYIHVTTGEVKTPAAGATFVNNAADTATPSIHYSDSARPDAPTGLETAGYYKEKAN